jgi:hypothetical protein
LRSPVDASHHLEKVLALEIVVVEAACFDLGTVEAVGGKTDSHHRQFVAY